MTHRHEARILFLKEFTSELMDPLMRISLEKNRPPIDLVEGERFIDMAGFNFLTDGWKRNLVREVWDAYGQIGEPVDHPIFRDYQLGKINAVIALAEGGNVAGTFDNHIARSAGEIYEEAFRQRSKDEMHEIVNRSLDSIEGELLAGPYGEKVSSVVNDKGEQVGEVAYVAELIKYLREVNDNKRDKA